MLKTLELVQTVIRNYEENECNEPQTLILKEAEERLKSLISNVKTKEANDIARLRAYKRVMKRASSSRPILKKSIINNDGFQVFTNSYELYQLKKHIVGSEIHTEEIAKNFPKVDGIINNTIGRCLLQHKIKTIELKKILSTKNKVDYYYQFDNITLLANDLKNMIDILGFKNNEEITINYSYANSSYTAVYVRRNEDMSIIMSIKN